MSDKGKDNFDEFNNCECNPFRPTNQLPFPGYAGQLLVTKSDFILPARPDLLEWKNIEEVIGVADIKLTFTNNDAVAHIWKLINNVWVEVGAIGQITAEEAIKLQSIEYIQYIVLEDVANHKIKLMGKKTEEGSYEDISTVNFVNYSDYSNFKTTTQGDIEGIETLLSELQATVESHGGEITSIYETIETIEANLAVINPIINILRQATNPGKVLVKSSDGASIEWKVLASIQGITLELDTVTNTLKLYQNNGGVEQLVGQWDNINRNEITSITNLLQPIANSLNQAGEAGEVLTKTSDGLHYNWKALDELITGSVSTDTTDSNYWKVSIKLNNETFIDFVVPKKTLIDSILSDITEIEHNFTYLQEETERLDTVKQGKLTAGANITISESNVISASGESTEVDDETIEFTENDKLKVKHDDTLIVGANGLSVSTDLLSIGHNEDEQLQVIHNETKGLKVGDGGLEVNVDNSSIQFNSLGQLYAEGGGSVDVDGKSIVYNDDDELEVNHDNTLQILDSHGLAVNVDWSTISSNSSGQVAVVYNQAKGLNVGDGGLEVKVDNSSIKFNSQGQLYTDGGGSVEVDDESIKYNVDGKLQIKNDTTLQVTTESGVGVNADWSTIWSNPSGQVAVLYNQNEGLYAGDGGLGINVDNVTLNFSSTGQLQQRRINLAGKTTKTLTFIHNNLLDTVNYQFELNELLASYMLINVDLILKYTEGVAGIGRFTLMLYGPDGSMQGLQLIDKPIPSIVARQNESYTVIGETILIPSTIYLDWVSSMRLQVEEDNEHIVQPTIERNNTKITFL